MGIVDNITHEMNEDGRIRIHAVGELYDYEAILSPEEDVNGNVHIPRSSIDTHGINDPFLKETILEVAQNNLGVHGEQTLIVDDD